MTFTGIVIDIVKYAVLLVVVLFAFLTLTSITSEVSWRVKARKAGATIPLTFWNHPFGFTEFGRIRQQAKNFKVNEYINSYFQRAGRHTIRNQLMTMNRVMTCDPENIKTVLATSFKDYSLGLRHPMFLPLLGDGIFTLSGPGWKHSRAMLRPQFSREQISQLETLNDHVNTLLNIFATNSANGEFDAQEQFFRLTLDTATEFLFGQSVDSLVGANHKLQGPRGPVSAQDFADNFNAALEDLTLRGQMSKLYWLSHIPDFKKHCNVSKNFVEYYVYRAIERQKNAEKAAADAEDGRYVFIDALARETSDPVLIRDQAFNILLAGRDTTASLLSFLIYYLARDKRVWEKLREAVLAEFGNDASTLTFETLRQCRYLQNVINEALRLSPIVPINSRFAIRDTILPRGGGPDESEPIFVPKGGQVMYHVWSMQHSHRYWGETAEQFIPERWDSGETHTWDYLPFNGGPRICLGQNFALTEASFTLVRIVQTFRDIVTSVPTPITPTPTVIKLTASLSHGCYVRFIRD